MLDNLREPETIAPPTHDNEKVRARHTGPWPVPRAAKTLKKIWHRAKERKTIVLTPTSLAFCAPQVVCGVRVASTRRGNGVGRRRSTVRIAIALAHLWRSVESLWGGFLINLWILWACSTYHRCPGFDRWVWWGPVFISTLNILLTISGNSTSYQAVFLQAAVVFS